MEKGRIQRAKFRVAAVVLLCIATTIAIVIAARGLLGISGAQGQPELSRAKGDRGIVLAPVSERLRALGQEAKDSFAADSATAGALVDLRKKLIDEVRASVTPEQADALADAFFTRLLAVMSGDYAAFEARVRTEGYALPPELATSSPRTWQLFIAQSRSWRIDLRTIEAAVNSSSAKPGESTQKVSYRAASGTELLPTFSADARAQSKVATVRVGVLFVDPGSDSMVPSFMGYEFRWNESARIWVAISPVSATSPNPKEPTPPPFPLF